MIPVRVSIRGGPLARMLSLLWSYDIIMNWYPSLIPVRVSIKGGPLARMLSLLWSYDIISLLIPVRVSLLECITSKEGQDSRPPLNETINILIIDWFQWIRKFGLQVGYTIHLNNSIVYCCQNIAIRYTYYDIFTFFESTCSNWNVYKIWRNGRFIKW